jgi:HEAT repeat protein
MTRRPVTTSSAKLHAELIPKLIDALRSKDGLERVGARQDLVLLGEAAVPALVGALGDREDQVRWEAAKALIDIPSPRATPALVEALGDEDTDVRWLAAEALVARDRQGAIAVLEALLRHSDSVWIREGAHHVLHDLGGKSLHPVLQPVLDTLDMMPPDWSALIPVSAAAALQELRSGSRRQDGGDRTAGNGGSAADADARKRARE